MLRQVQRKMKKTMMAANLHGAGDLRYEEVPMPVCGPDEVLLAVRFCGICGSDVPRVLSKGTYHFPTIPGHEFSGVIQYDPRQELTGKRVAVYPLIPCRKCDMCQKELYELCRDYDYYGSRRDGGYAEYLAVRRWNVVPLPDAVSFEEGAMCEPVSVAHHAVSRLYLQPGDRVLISGAGPIGLLAAQWMRAFGASEIYLFDIVPEKIAFARQMGFEAYRDGVEVDAVLEGTGFSDALARCLEAVRHHGSVVLMGNPSRAVELSQKTYWCILRKELNVTGTWNSGFNSRMNDWTASLEAMAEKRIRATELISHFYPLSQCNEAFSMIAGRREFYNRVMFRIGEAPAHP